MEPSKSSWFGRRVAGRRNRFGCWGLRRLCRRDVVQYGKTKPASGHAADALLDKFMPDFDVPRLPSGYCRDDAYVSTGGGGSHRARFSIGDFLCKAVRRCKNATTEDRLTGFCDILSTTLGDVLNNMPRWQYSGGSDSNANG